MRLTSNRNILRSSRLSFSFYCILFLHSYLYYCEGLFSYVEARGARKSLPNEKLVIGYGSDVKNVKTAVQKGVNVVIWSFCDIAPDTTSGNRRGTKIITNLNLAEIQQFVQEETNKDLVNLVSFGGWNGPHLNPDLSASKWYEGFREHLGGIFDGFDWDLEGHDNLQSATNEFSIQCLQKMAAVSRMAKTDGYVVAMAPPQSYLDFGHSWFSRRVNFTDPTREWHNDFSYFGRNVYAYLLAIDPASIDFVSIQFYESYSRAAESVYHFGKTPADYLVEYVQTIASNHEKFFVDFSSDLELGLSSRDVELPVEKLVLGFANDWASPDKNFVVTQQDLASAWDRLCEVDITPRGVMFWTIEEEDRSTPSFASILKGVVDRRCGLSPTCDANETTSTQ